MRAALKMMLVPLSSGLLSCSTGAGTGSITSDRLIVSQCMDGPFDLEPTFFASDPFNDTQQIRVQRGDRDVGTSDGVFIVVSDVSKIRAAELGKPIPLGLPVGVNPPGFPTRVLTDPPTVTLALYLYNTCHIQNGAVYSVGGTITFDSLFSGDRNENRSADRLTDAHFEALVADPRSAALVDVDTADAGAPVDAGAAFTGNIKPEFPPNTTSTVTGSFRFFFQRGEPAQPFQ